MDKKAFEDRCFGSPTRFYVKDGTDHNVELLRDLKHNKLLTLSIIYSL